MKCNIHRWTNSHPRTIATSLIYIYMVKYSYRFCEYLQKKTLKILYSYLLHYVYFVAHELLLFIRSHLADLLVVLIIASMALIFFWGGSFQTNVCQGLA